MSDKIDLFRYFLGGTILITLCGTMLAQLIWLIYCAFTASMWRSFNAFLLIAVTVIAFLPPYDYASLSRTMVCALLMIPLAIFAVVCDPPRFKILALAHLGFAVLLFYVTFLSAA